MNMYLMVYATMFQKLRNSAAVYCNCYMYMYIVYSQIYTFMTHTHTIQHTGSDTIALVPTRGAVDDDPVHSAYTIAPEW